MTSTARFNTSTSFHQGSQLWILQGGSIVGSVVNFSGQYVLTLFGSGASVGHREFGSLMGAKLYLKKFLLA